MADLSIVTSSAQSPSAKSAAIEWWRQMKAQAAAIRKHGPVVARAMDNTRKGGESLLAGGLLGAVAANGKTGLDVSVGGKFKVPVDGAAAVVGLGLSTFLPGADYSEDLANVGAAAAAVFAFRQTQALIKTKKMTFTGDYSSSDEFTAASQSSWGAENDPLLAMAAAI